MVSATPAAAIIVDVVWVNISFLSATEQAASVRTLRGYCTIGKLLGSRG
jgi:hypothetical protein